VVKVDAITTATIKTNETMTITKDVITTDFVTMDVIKIEEGESHSIFLFKA